jgi:hypothetical protein
VDLLVAESHQAALVVLGARGVGGVADLLAGSVAVGVASRLPVSASRGGWPDSGTVFAALDG